jgi:FtsH-binding integral membrane protein
MYFALIASLSAACLFFGMLICSEVGRRIGIAKLARDSEGLTKGAGAAEGAVFGLLGLLIAFTFSGAATRFEGRRHLVTDEANAIGTAYLRVDLLPGDAQPEIKGLFRRYLDARSATYQNLEDQAATNAKLAEATALQGDIWTKSLTACLRPGAPAQAAMLLLPALNEMIDITTTTLMATQNHPPLVVFLLLCGLSLVGALLVGYGTSTDKDRNWFHTVVFAAFLSLTVYVIVDIEFPRLGLIRVDAADQVLRDLRKSMQ